VLRSALQQALPAGDTLSLPPLHQPPVPLAIAGTRERLARTHNRYRRKIDPAAVRLHFGELPDRPKGMHRATYDRLTEGALAALEAREAILDEQIIRVLMRMGFGQDLS